MRHNALIDAEVSGLTSGTFGVDLDTNVRIERDVHIVRILRGQASNRHGDEIINRTTPRLQRLYTHGG
ncbi:hypothetical protein [Arthrobacter sp. TWP1-1]|uniref:hypothetical protein n=1 Tax=Arthrobacter sp. TWP1-1 TaxID=2804568 RepID=UPI003CF3CF19